MTLAYAVESEVCKKSFYEFVKSFWSVIIAEEPVFNWHIEYLCSELQTLAWYIVNRQRKPYDVIINIPPGTTKTTITTIMFPAWLWTQAPWIRIITNSYAGDLSVEHASKSKDIIMSEKYKILFPNVIIRRDKSGKEAYENTEMGSRLSTSTNSAITGKHAHIIINDDPVNPKQADSVALRNQSNIQTQTLSTRKVDKKGTPMVTIMQRLHELDVTGFLLSKKADKIRHICLPAEVTGNVKPESVREKYINGLLDPIRLDREVLEEAKIDLGARAYAGQYEQNPVADGGNIIKKDWFKYISQDNFNVAYRNEPIIFFADTAYTADAANDPTGLIATCKIGNDLYVLHGKKVYQNFPNLCRFIPAYVMEHGYKSNSSIRIEPKANGLSVIDQLKEATGLNVTKTVSPTEAKDTRLNAASPKVECGRVILVQGSWCDEFVEEISGFPAKAHDEYVDLLCYAIDYHLKPTQNRINLQSLSELV